MSERTTVIGLWCHKCEGWVNFASEWLDTFDEDVDFYCPICGSKEVIWDNWLLPEKAVGCVLILDEREEE